MRCDQAVETEPQCRRIAAEGELDSLAGQGLGLTLEQRLGNQSRPVSTPERPAGGIAGTPLFEWASPLFLLFLQEIISDY
jgi:hypothetical protein